MRRRRWKHRSALRSAAKGKIYSLLMWEMGLASVSDENLAGLVHHHRSIRAGDVDYLRAREAMPPSQLHIGLKFGDDIGEGKGYKIGCPGRKLISTVRAHAG